MYMYTFKNYCERKFPKNWEVVDKGLGLFHFRDNLITKGEGFVVAVQEEINNFEVTLLFESFAKKLLAYSETQISNSKSPLRKLIDVNTNLTVVVYRHYIEMNLDPLSNKFESLDFKLIYKKLSEKSDADKFSDILISFILYIFPYKLESEEEGSSSLELFTKYERSHLNRSLCIAYYGYNCRACGINLKDIYGDIARDFIHVHHINPISGSGTVKPDPIEDFVPLCPNCHAIAHLKSPPLTIKEIQIKINENGKSNT